MDARRVKRLSDPYPKSMDMDGSFNATVEHTIMDNQVRVRPRDVLATIILGALYAVAIVGIMVVVPY